MSKESVLSKTIGKRCVIGFAHPSGGVQMTIAKILDVDDKFIQIESKPNNGDPMEISSVPPVTTYASIDTIDTITDADDDNVFKHIISKMKPTEGN